MTLEQLNEAMRLKELAEKVAKINHEFVNLDGGIIFTKQGTASNPTTLNLSSGPVHLRDRPEVLAASQSCMLLMRNALEAEAARTAKAFDDFTFPA